MNPVSQTQRFDPREVWKPAPASLLDMTLRQVPMDGYAELLVNGAIPRHVQDLVSPPVRFDLHKPPAALPTPTFCAAVRRASQALRRDARLKAALEGLRPSLADPEQIRVAGRELVDLALRQALRRRLLSSITEPALLAAALVLAPEHAEVIHPIPKPATSDACCQAIRHNHEIARELGPWREHPRLAGNVDMARSTLGDQAQLLQLTLQNLVQAQAQVDWAARSARAWQRDMHAMAMRILRGS